MEPNVLPLVTIKLRIKSFTKMAPLSILRRKRRDVLKTFNAKMKRMDIRFQLFMSRYRIAVEQYTNMSAKLNVEIAKAEAAEAVRRQKDFEQFVKDMDAQVASYKSKENAIIVE